MPLATLGAMDTRIVTDLIWFDEDGARTEVLHETPHLFSQIICLQHAQGVRSQPRDLLRRIPQLQLLEIPEAAICCGSAGIYNLVQPEAATQLGDRKASHVAALDADMVVSGNPGCLLQLQSALSRSGRKLPVRHIVELLDASIRGISL